MKPATTPTTTTKAAPTKEKNKPKKQKSALLRNTLSQGYKQLYKNDFLPCFTFYPVSPNTPVEDAMQVSERIKIYAYLKKPKAKESRVYLRLLTTRKGKGKNTNEPIGTIPCLVVKVRHWKDGGLTNAAPIEQRQQLDAIQKRVNELQADLAQRPRRVTPSTAAAWIWPQAVDLWAKLDNACNAQPKQRTRVSYSYALQRFKAFSKGQQPTVDLYRAWVKTMDKSPLMPRSCRAYAAAVRSMGNDIGLVFPRVKQKAVKPADVYALTLLELDAIARLELSGKQSLVRDAFVCACLCALRKSDWHNFSLANLGKEVRNEKNGKFSLLPETLKALIQRHGQAIHLPMKDPNYTIGRILKQAAKVCPSLNVEVMYYGSMRPKWNAITSHCGRRTFVTLGYANGATAKELMAMTTHGTEAMLMNYAKDLTTNVEQLERANATSRKVIDLDSLGMPQLPQRLKVAK
jgi:integrase